VMVLSVGLAEYVRHQETDEKNASAVLTVIIPGLHHFITFIYVHNHCYCRQTQR